MNFIEKHLDDRFYLEGEQRIQVEAQVNENLIVEFCKEEKTLKEIAEYFVLAFAIKLIFIKYFYLYNFYDKMFQNEKERHSNMGKKMEKIKEIVKREKIVIIAVIVAILVEIFCFNYSFFRTLIVGNLNVEPEYTFEDGTIKISGIDTRVTGITFEYAEDLTDKVTYNLIYAAEERSYTYELNSKVILAEDKQYINFDTHSNCKAIEISLLTDSNIEIENVVLNQPNMNISLFRILLLAFALIFILKVKDGSIYKKQYDQNSKWQNRLFLINLTVVCLLILMYTLCQFNTENYIIQPEEVSGADATLAQAEALVNGQITLLQEPSEELKNMENPYDDIKRDTDGVDYFSDIAYYNGHYYSYFGIAPVLTTVLPFRLITGVYTHTYIFNLVYIFGAIYALYFLYKKLVNKFIKKISLCNFYLGFYAILLASNFLTLLRGQKYDIVVSCGIMFLLIALNLSLSLYEKPKLKILKLILLGLATGLIVLSKPNLIVYYILILFCIMASMKNLNRKEKIKDWVVICVPLGLLAVFQMLLNYTRFDNILEFGAKYQLTDVNMNYCMDPSFGKIYAGFVEYIFRAVTINPLKFPFVFANVDTGITSINEVCYENRLIGLISVPIFWTILFKGKFVKNSADKNFKYFIRISLICVLLAIVIATTAGGICEAYAIDFKLILAICSVLILQKMLAEMQADAKTEGNEKDTNQAAKHSTKEFAIMNRIYLVLCVASILIMLPLSLTTESNFLIDNTCNITVYLKNIFEFWS